MKIHPATALFGDITPFGRVVSVKCARFNRTTTLTFEDGSSRFFKYGEEVEILNSDTML